MAGEKVTIDPDFEPRSEPPSRQGHTVRRIGLLAVVVAVVAYGWLLQSSMSPVPEPSEEAAPESTPRTNQTASMPPTTTSAAPRRQPLAALDEPLETAVPGFTDTLVMLTTPHESLNIMRSQPSQPKTKVVLSLSRNDPNSGGRPIGLDVSGNWFGQVREDGALTVYAIPTTQRLRPLREAVGLHVRSMSWHNTDPG